MPNSWHNAVNDFSPRLAVTTKLTRCSRTSIVFHGIDRYAPALAALARECKGCLETFRKGCHETEHFLWLEWELPRGSRRALPHFELEFAVTADGLEIGARGLHAVLLIQHDFRWHTANGGSKRRNRDCGQILKALGFSRSIITAVLPI